MEQNSLKLALLESMKSNVPLVRIVLRSKTMKKVIDILEIAHIYYYIPRSNSEAWYAANENILTLAALLQHVPLFQYRKSSDFFLVSPKFLTKLCRSFWINRCEIRNACDKCGSFSSIVTMLLVELFDV